MKNIIVSVFAAILIFGCHLDPSNPASPVADDNEIEMYVEHHKSLYSKQSQYGVAEIYANKRHVGTVLPGITDTVYVPDGAELTAKWLEQYSSSQGTWQVKINTTTAKAGLIWQL